MSPDLSDPEKLEHGRKGMKNGEDKDNNNSISLGLRRGGNSAAEIPMRGKREENTTHLTVVGESCQQR